jgi:hypothetical protein
MTPELPVTPPAHPLPALTTAELARYRRQLETALAPSAAQAPALPGQAGLRDQLAAVLAEQASRARLTAGGHGHA